MLREYLPNLIPLTFRFFFLLTPFFVLGTFLTVTEDSEESSKKKLAVKIAVGASVVCLLMFICGSWVMSLFGISINAFRAGSGILLLLMAIGLVHGPADATKHAYKNETDLLQSAVVPLAVPVTAGPATLGTLIVLGLEQTSYLEKLVTCVAILLAVWMVGLMLIFSGKLLKLLGRANVAILGKITGLILSAIAVQMIVVGVRAIWTTAH